MELEDEEPPLRRGHRHAAEAQLAESTRSWTKAMYKHQEAARCFTDCLGLTGHPQANKAILLLINKHTKRFEEIRDKLAYNKSVKNVLIQNGYNIHPPNLHQINDEMYEELRNQMQQIVSYSLQKLAVSNTHIVIDDHSNTDAYKQKMHQYLEKCDVRKSINMSNPNKRNEHDAHTENDETNTHSDSDTDKSMNINKTKIVLNDNFFNPDHEQQSKKQLIANNQRLCERVKYLESQLKTQTELTHQYQTEMSNKVSALRQSLDHLYNTNNPNRGKNKSSKKGGAADAGMDSTASALESNSSDRSFADGDGNGKDSVMKAKKVALDSKEVQQVVEVKVTAERKKWENDRERLRNIHAKQLQELKKKIKDWMDYAKKQEQHAKIYKKQLQLQLAKSKSSAPPKASSASGFNANVTSPAVSHGSNKIYPGGTLRNAPQGAIPESQEVDQDEL